MSSGLYKLFDSFSSWGSATGVLPTLDFAKSKSILLDVLATLTPNTWYATTDLIERMKKEHPWFLIPKEVYIEENAGWNKPKKKVLYPRYYNFIEGERYGRSGTMKDRCIKENDPKAFEKVEGRFIERFLTRYLYTLGYVHIGMDKNPYTGEKPEMGTLIAFQLQSTFFHVLNNQLLSTKVSVQPNFEIYIDAPTYPIAILNALAPLTKMLKEDQQIILKLEKKYVLNHLIEHPTFDTAQFLSNLSDTPIPQNVLMEMQEWTERTDVFTLYEGFGLYEGYTKQALADIHTEATIIPTIRLIRKPTNLYEKLQKSEVIPMLIEHTDKNFTPLPTLAKSIFPSLKVEKTKKSAKQKITIERKEWLVYTISNKSFYEAFLSVLLKARIPVTFDKEKRSISFFKSDEASLKTILKDFKTDYQVSIKK